MSVIEVSLLLGTRMTSLEDSTYDRALQDRYDSKNGNGSFIELRVRMLINDKMR